MAHHQQSNHDRSLAAQGMSSSNGLHSSANQSTSGDDDLTSDDDEPPHFSKMITPTFQNSSFEHSCMASQHLQRSRKESLLTQALLTSPELTSLSDAEAPVLTSDGGMTSPARTTTPSPPPPVINHGGFVSLISSHKMSPAKEPTGDGIQVAQATGADRSQETKVEADLGRRRCISFACGRQTITRKQNDQPPNTQANIGVSPRPTDPPKRPCVLRFACPMKPSHTDLSKSKSGGSSVDKPVPPEAELEVPIPDVSLRERRNSASTAKTSSNKHNCTAPVSAQPRRSQVFNRIDFQKSEATRFHEFAGPFNAEDEWINEQTAYRQKITINDTLRKENAIRKLAEEAEEEALEEEADEELDDYNNGNEFDDEFDDNGRDYSDEASDGGNETDDEEGFADSDDESDGNSDYQFWTPGLTTAATSTGYIEHIRPAAPRAASESSIEFTNDAKRGSTRARKQLGTHESPRMRPGTPELPDDAEFVIGTLDEDRPLEDAYMSCLEERRRSRHKLVPQDIDPSFPTSEPEADNDDDDEENATQVHDEPEWVTGRPDSSGEDHSKFEKNGSPPTKASDSPMPSPKRIHSPPPKKGIVHRSPPPRRLFGQSTHRLRSPPPMHRKLASPPSSRRASISGSPCESHGINMPHLAQRPNLTHTTSLPRTPNPFWDQHRRSRFHGFNSPLVGTSPKSTGPSPMDLHSRGPIDIVQGLETKRQRRKDKFWRQHCRHAGKEKERRCQPGKGAERMRELGLEMADRCKGYGQKAQLVLSI
ncbi:hypothetical protein HO173_001989 [Letharia columbiana]|uniref:Uncharacterized protein n=1 Tax=Letharia columbiana TaxID=112416 RepID=A0A8H6G4E8_9LECA|nr:uncharacterized protein HO173_001989 [Letharia columbiana]KAF6240378.1 hypothetical protein HO173_001989 [Letharia columbiana]